METPGSNSIISDITLSTSEEEKTENSTEIEIAPPPAGFHWIGSKPVLIYDVKGFLCGASKPVPYLDLAECNAQEANKKVYSSFYYRLNATQAKCLLCPEITKPIGVQPGWYFYPLIMI